MADAPASQTLSRGIRLLEVLADARTALSIGDLARRIDVHRSIAYRLLRTLEDHGLVARDAAGLVRLAPRMAALAAGVAADLQAEALPELTTLANAIGATSFLAVLDHDECITLASVEPRHAVASVAQHPGTRHPVTRGAPGKAILASLAESAWPDGVDDPLRAEVHASAARGYAVSHDEVIPGLRAVAVPLDVRDHPPAALAVVYLAIDHGEAEIADGLTRAASAIRDALGG